MLVNANTQASGGGGVQADLEIFLPREVPVDIATRRGDVMISSRSGDVKISTKKATSPWTMSKETLKSIWMEDRNSVLPSLAGNIAVQGRADDIDISEVDGTVRLNGDFFGAMRVASVTKSVIFQSVSNRPGVGASGWRHEHRIR